MRTIMTLGLLLAVVLAFGETAFADTTWKDEKSGLTWQVTSTGGGMSFEKAKAHCSSLSLAGFTDWRLPTKKELLSLIRGCGITLSDFCDPGKGPANGCYWPDEMKGKCSTYRSSSILMNLDDLAWTVSFKNGPANGQGIDLDFHVRCVR